MMRKRLGLVAGGWMGLAMLALTAAPVQAGEAEAQVLQILNQARVAKGCPALVVNPRLVAAARVQSDGMALKNYFSHVGADGHRFTYRAKAQGYQYRLIGENIAAGQKTAQEVARDWLNSPPHRRNILNCTFLETGIAMTGRSTATRCRCTPIGRKCSGCRNDAGPHPD